MQTTRRLLALTLAASIVVGCTGASGTDGGGKDTGKDGGTHTTSPEPTFSVAPGTNLYTYANAGLVATLDIEGTAGTLKIQNQTGRELPKPSFYILDARDGTRIDGKVDASTSVADGQTRSFPVSFSGIEDKNIGLVVLLMGQDNYGAFVRQ